MVMLYSVDCLPSPAAIIPSSAATPSGSPGINRDPQISSIVGAAIKSIHCVLFNKELEIVKMSLNENRYKPSVVDNVEKYTLNAIIINLEMRQSVTMLPLQQANSAGCGMKSLNLPQSQTDLRTVSQSHSSSLGQFRHRRYD